MAPAFGTDGVRGVANVELTPEFVLGLGRAAAVVLGRGPWVVGRDTRISGPMLGAALAAGLAAEGASVVDLGVVTTPAVAWACASRGLPGAVISASHNPFADNGVKLFAPGGRKLSPEVEHRIEAELARGRSGAGRADADIPGGAAVGVVACDPSVAGGYADGLVAALEGRRLDGMAVFLDCANGAASGVACDVFTRAGASVTVLHAEPDGTNINAACGSTHPESLQRAVAAAQRTGEGGGPAGDGAIGLAFDGDADRVVAVDERGGLVDGDHILALTALDLRDRGRLAHDTVVVTVLTNLGFRLAMEAAGLHVVQTDVGDRHVLEAMHAGGFSLGGEQSGHVIFGDLATTGDGILVGLVLADLVRRHGSTLHALASAAMTRLPQATRNVVVAERGGLAGAGAVWEEVRSTEALLGATGRVVLRPSGTEPLVRVMVEAPTAGVAEAAADRLAGAVATALGQPGDGTSRP